jgi:hypothetical protein
MDRNGDHDVKGSKPSLERQTVHVLAYMQNLHLKKL